MNVRNIPFGIFNALKQAVIPYENAYHVKFLLQ